SAPAHAAAFFGTAAQVAAFFGSAAQAAGLAVGAAAHAAALFGAALTAFLFPLGHFVASLAVVGRDFPRRGLPKTWLVFHHGAAAGFLGARDQIAPRLGHGQVQLPLPLLHASGGSRMARPRRGPELRGDLAARPSARTHGCRRGEADRRRASRSARPAGARRHAGTNTRPT